MYANILVPVSFESDRDASGALDVAKSLCKPGGKITLFHVIEQVPTYATTYFPPGFSKEAEAKMKARLDEMAEGEDNVTAQIVHGHSARTILDFADAQKKDLIIVASHQPGMQDLLLGSTAARVVRHATCAVHVVR
jgi:universal stress protein F